MTSKTQEEVTALGEAVAEAERLRLRLDAGEVAEFTANLGKDEALRRFRRLAEWLAGVNAFNNVGVLVTPVIVRHLAQEGDFESLLSELDGLRAQTLNGHFSTDNSLQRDLEFLRFRNEDQKVNGPRPKHEIYKAFSGLAALPPAEEVALDPGEEFAADVQRAAYEAVGLLTFLREFRSATDRPIIVVGNDKSQLAGGGYGRQWVVEPLEDHLRGDFEVMFNRVPSHGTHRLVVPCAFPKEVVRRMSDEVPHLVIVDGASPGKTAETVRFSKATRSYANWFAAFNDLRAEGDESPYIGDGLLLAEHYHELKRWHEYTSVREQIETWVTPGPGYKLALWGPGPTPTALLGDVYADWPEVQFRGDRPLAILANPIVYRTDVTTDDRKISPAEEALSPFLRDSRPYYLDSVDRVHRRLLEQSAPDWATFTHWGAVDDNPVGPAGALNPAFTMFGFGPYGFERRVCGPTNERFVAQVQKQIKAEIGRILSKA